MVDERERELLLRIRQAVIIIIGAVEEYLDLPRSIEPKRKKKTA